VVLRGNRLSVWGITIILVFSLLVFPGCQRQENSDSSSSAVISTPKMEVQTYRSPSVLHYRFDGSHEDYVEDVSGNGHVGSIHGAKWDESSGALLFDGKGDFVRIASAEDLSFQGPFLIEVSFLVYKEPASYMALLVKRGSTSEAIYGLWLYKDKVYCSLKSEQREKSVAFMSTISISPNVWHDVEVRRDKDGTVACWIDGRKDIAGGILGGLIDPPGDLYIGRHSTDSAQDFTGAFGEVRICSWPINAAQGVSSLSSRSSIILNGPSAFASSNGEVTIQFSAVSAAKCHIEHSSLTEYKTTGKLSRVVQPETHVENGAKLHNVVLEHLDSNTQYVYRLIAEIDGNVWKSPLKAFVTDSCITVGSICGSSGDCSDYDPAYETNVVSFDSSNRPFIRSRTTSRDCTDYIQTREDGEWVKRGFIDVIREYFPTFVKTLYGGGWRGARIIFDENDVLYTIVTLELEDGSSVNVLLYSHDFGKSFELCKLPSGIFFMPEYRSSSNKITGPPFIGFLRFYEEYPTKWANHYSLCVMQPRFVGRELVIPEPILITHDCIGVSLHSGGAPFAITSGNKTHFIWTELSDDGGVSSPVYAATFYHDAGQVGEKSLVCRAYPANDMHCTPGICMDSTGILHVVSGSHAQSFQYAYSLVPNLTEAGWSDPIAIPLTPSPTANMPTTSGGTYVSLLCDDKDTLHLVFRETRMNLDQYFPGEQYNSLSYCRKIKGEEWSLPRMLVVPPIPGYSIYYQKLSMNRNGMLFLSFSLLTEFEMQLTYEIRPGIYHDQTILVTSDGGDTWRVAADSDFWGTAKKESDTGNIGN